MSAPAAVALGLTLGGPRAPHEAAQQLERVEWAERAGLHSVWLPEGHFTHGAMPSPLVTLASFSARTRRIVLGTTSLLLPVREAGQVADEVTTLDHLSGGRVWLGLGRGFRAPLFRAFGVAVAEKRDRFDAVLDAVLARWSDGTGPAPIQKPHPPLLMAAFGRKGLLQAASRGLPYLASPMESLDTLAENYAFHRDNLPAEPESPLRVPVIRAVHVARDDAEADRVLEAMRIESRQMSRVLPPALARAAAGEVEDRAIVGTADRVRDTVARYRERIGLDLLIARGGVPGASTERFQEGLEQLAEEILPGLTA